MEGLSLGMTIYILALAGILGLCVGSFLLCAVSRRAAGQSFVRGRSKCAACGHELKPIELIPALSYIFQKGRCKSCGAKIPVSCLVAELVSCAVFVSIPAVYGLTPRTVQLLLLGVLLLWESMNDLETMEIPNACILAGIILRLVFVFTSGNILPELIASAIGALSLSLPVFIIVLIFEKIKKVEAMGGGDIKLLFMIGLFFTWQLNIMTIIFSCVLGIVFAAVSNFASKNPSTRPFPFGPAIAAGAWLTALVGQPLLSWYMGLF